MTSCQKRNACRTRMNREHRREYQEMLNQEMLNQGMQDMQPEWPQSNSGPTVAQIAPDIALRSRFQYLEERVRRRFGRGPSRNLDRALVHIPPLPPRPIRRRTWSISRTFQLTNQPQNTETHDVELVVRLLTSPRKIQEHEESCTSSYYLCIIAGIINMSEQ